MVGQTNVTRTLRNAIEGGKIGHAFLLSGARGVGKTTTARILARALNYELPDGSVTGPTIAMPKLGLHDEAIIESRHPDVLEMDAASHNSVDDVRQINDAIRYAPMSARYKVYIIDEVHMLSKAAFNGLLKTLLPFEPERKRYDGHGKKSHIFGSFGNYRGSTCSGTSAHSGCNKYHFGIFAQNIRDFINTFEGRFPTNFGFVARATTFGKRCSQLDFNTNGTAFQCLGISIAYYEVYIFNTLTEHVVYCIVSATANTHNLDDG